MSIVVFAAAVAALAAMHFYPPNMHAIGSTAVAVW
jgi:hypothetical protein